jgi:hypothetical protein
MLLDMQISGCNSIGQCTNVGRAIGTYPFDDGNCAYWLQFVLCRQSGYVTPDFRVSVNCVGVHQFSGTDGSYAVCGSSASGLNVDAQYTHPSIVQNLGFRLEGVYYSHEGAQRPAKTRTWDSPYN